MRILILVLLFCSCNASKRIQKIAEKNQLLRIIDSVKIKEYEKFDTFKITNRFDSFTLENQKVITKVFRHNDTIRIFQDIQADTIYIKETRIEIKPNEKKVKKQSRLIYALISCLIVSFVIIYLLK
jgi:hypothetical protein